MYHNKVLVKSSDDNYLRQPIGLVFKQKYDIWVADQESGRLLHYKGICFIESVTVSGGSIQQPRPNGLIDNNSKGFVISEEGVFNQCPVFIYKDIFIDSFNAQTGMNVPGLCEEPVREQTIDCVGCVNDVVPILKSASSSLITCTLEGLICAYSPLVNETTALVAFTSNDNASYTGMTQIGDKIYVADNRNGKIDVIDSNWVKLSGYTFTNPELPDNYYPLNIQLINGGLIVTYVLKDGEEIVQNTGFVSLFDYTGKYERSFMSECFQYPYGVTTKLEVEINHKCPPVSYETLLISNHFSGTVFRFLFKTGEQLEDVKIQPQLNAPFSLVENFSDSSFIYTADNVIGKLSKHC